jgi:hypothetical protein
MLYDPVGDHQVDGVVGQRDSTAIAIAQDVRFVEKRVRSDLRIDVAADSPLGIWLKQQQLSFPAGGSLELRPTPGAEVQDGGARRADVNHLRIELHGAVERGQA